MDWIQLVLPTEGMQRAILEYRNCFDENEESSGLPWEELEEDYFSWLQEQNDRMLGISEETDVFCFAVDPEDRVVAVVHLSGRGKKEYTFHFCPGYAKKDVLEQQLIL